MMPGWSTTSTATSTRSSISAFFADCAAQHDQYEVRRIIKAFIDGQWLAEFDRRLGEYHDQLDARRRV